MNKLMMVLVAACAANALAMPTKDELKKAQPLVAELMATPMAGFKAAAYKEKSAAAAKVADTSVEFAKAAETEAAKFLLLKGAVSYYVRAEQYDKAADAIKAMQSGVKDIPPAVIVEITGKAAGKISETKAPELFAIYRQAKLQSRAGEDVKTLAAKLKKVQSDAIRRRYAEALAISRDWKSAYAEFAKVNDPKLKAIAEAEASGKAKSAEAGEFWWDYKSATEDAEDFFKSHAAAFYRQALASGEITGLKKNLVEQRIKDVPVIVGEASGLTVARQDAAPTSTRVTTATSSPASSSGNAGWQEKGNIAWLTLTNGEKLEFVKCPAGTVEFPTELGRDAKFKNAKIARPFWIMTKPIAKRNLKGYSCFDANRWKAISDPYDYAYLTFENSESLSELLTDNFKDSLPKGYVVRNPSIAEWTYATRANSRDDSDPYSSFNNKQSDAGKKIYNPGAHGNSPKNKWGLHEYYHEEQLLDRFAVAESDRDKRTPIWSIQWQPEFAADPLTWTDSPDGIPAHICLRTNHGETYVLHSRSANHIRLVVGPDLVGEWKAKHGTSASTTATSSPDSSSGNAGWQEKCNTATLTLGNGEKLEFVKCPAGGADFRIGCFGAPEFKRVKITRPFWIMTRPLAMRNLKGYSQYKSQWNGKDGDYDYTWGMTHADTESFADTLNDELKEALPKGYVVRNPTLAEWEYAFRANSRDPNDIYQYQNIDNRNTDAAAKLLAENPQGKSPKNKWGIHEFSINEQLLDRFIAGNSEFGFWGDPAGKKPNKDKLATVNKIIWKPEYANDPLVWTDDPEQMPAWRFLRLSKTGRVNVMTDRKGEGHVRLVVGPDLVGEWKARNGKK